MAMANITVPIQVNLPDDWIEQIVNRLRNDPESEWVEIVRCKDCAHYIKHDKRCAVWNHGGIVTYGFCFLGERRTDETDDIPE